MLHFILDFFWKEKWFTACCSPYLCWCSPPRDIHCLWIKTFTWRNSILYELRSRKYSGHQLICLPNEENRGRSKKKHNWTMKRSSYNFFLVSLPFLTLTVFFFLFYFFLFNSISNKAAGAATQKLSMAQKPCTRNVCKASKWRKYPAKKKQQRKTRGKNFEWDALLSFFIPLIPCLMH